MILRILSCCFVLQVGSAAEAANSMCDIYMNMTVGLAGAAGSVENGILKVDASSKQYISRSSESQAKIRMMYFPGHMTDAANIATDVSVLKKGDVVTVARRADASVKIHPTDVIGFEAKFDMSRADGCELVQNVALFRDANGIETKRLAFDKKYCDSVREILGEHGDAAATKEKLRTCTDFLGNMQEAFNVRKAELQKENILMSDVARPMSVRLSSPYAENGAVNVLAVMSNCAPLAWTQFAADLRLLTERGTSPANTKRDTKN